MSSHIFAVDSFSRITPRELQEAISSGFIFAIWTLGSSEYLWASLHSVEENLQAFSLHVTLIFRIR